MEYRELSVQERYRVKDFYRLTTYKQVVSTEDRVFVAEERQVIYGAVRIESKDGIQVLRGMYMHPEHLRKGIGRELLHHIQPVLSQADSYCIPGVHLFEFYGQVGFREIPTETAPAFLIERIQRYMNEGKPVAIMLRSDASGNVGNCSGRL